MSTCKDLSPGYFAGRKVVSGITLVALRILDFGRSLEREGTTTIAAGFKFLEILCRNAKLEQLRVGLAEVVEEVIF